MIYLPRNKFIFDKSYTSSTVFIYINMYSIHCNIKSNLLWCKYILNNNLYAYNRPTYNRSTILLVT